MIAVQWGDFQQPLSVDSVSRVTGVLGSLSRWWLTDRAKQIADELDQTDYWTQRPTLPTQAGACWVLIVNSDTTTRELLRDAFLLPLIWVRGTSHSDRLPVPLRALADNVLQSVLKSRSADEPTWGLHLSLDSVSRDEGISGQTGNTPDFRELPAGLLDFRSGWVTLAGTLLTAVRGVPTNPRVWSTGCWDAQAGIIEVGGLQQKLQLAHQYFQDRENSPEGEAFVVVPSGNLIESNRFAAQWKSRFKAVEFPPAQLDPQLALSGYLALLRVPPPTHAPVAAHVAYYRSIFADNRNLANQYYDTTLYPLVVHQCRQRIGAIVPAPTHLVTVVSPNNELVQLAVEVFGIKQCVLLYTVPGDESAYMRQIVDMTPIANQAAAACERLGCTAYLKPFTYDAGKPRFREELSATILDLVKPHLADVPDEQVAFDMQSAHKIFNYVFDHAVSRPGNLMYWIDHLWFPAFKTPHPMTERFVVWRAGDDWSGRGPAGLERE